MTHTHNSYSQFNMSFHVCVCTVCFFFFFQQKSHSYAVIVLSVTSHYCLTAHPVCPHLKQTLYDVTFSLPLSLSFFPPNATPGYSDFLRGQRTVQTHTISLSACKASTCPFRFGFRENSGSGGREVFFGFISIQVCFSF